MKNKINYTEGEIGEIEIVKDFLPSPAELARRESNVRVTINLRRSSVNFFKTVARKNKVQYQRVIRSLLDTYATSYSNTKSKREFRRRKSATHGERIGPTKIAQQPQRETRRMLTFESFFAAPSCNVVHVARFHRRTPQDGNSAATSNYSPPVFSFPISFLSLSIF